MASKIFIILAIVAIVLPTVAIATEYIVGDNSGWTVKYDYKAWAADKTFYVGDKLVFHYNPGNHSVFKVNATGFNDCIIPPKNEGLFTGNDIITLATPGKKWYVCGVGKHCADLGMKLVINVQGEGPTAAPPPNSAGFQITSSAPQVITAAMVFIAMIIV